MRLSFSTLGCPDWQFEDIFSIASDLGYNGIEIRGIADEIYAPKIKNIETINNKLQKAGIKIPILTSGAYLADNPDIGEAYKEIEDYAKLAQKLGIKYIRVMGEKTPEPICPDDILFHFKALCEITKTYGVELLIETNGFLADSTVMRDFIAGFENCGVLWDVHHTVRYFQETPAYTVKNIGKFIKHTHIKDSVVGRNGKLTYMLTGYGDIPIEEAVRELKNIGYDGYYSYEWVKRWANELAEPGVAFYQYIIYMKDLE
ncbi:MAG: sugar phosphate isomerase/epimerase [Oscillospiraceae bacterium]|nr:sugar phosphate isomerase/epimerase [Oscillospiraceae bacterium]